MVPKPNIPYLYIHILFKLMKKLMVHLRFLHFLIRASFTLYLFQKYVGLSLSSVSSHAISFLLYFYHAIYHYHNVLCCHINVQHVCMRMCVFLQQKGLSIISGIQILHSPKIKGEANKEIHHISCLANIRNMG